MDKEVDTAEGTLPQEEGVYGYVLGVDPATGRTLTGGAHEILVPADRSKRDAIDSANMPGRLHPELAKSAYRTYDAAITNGETDFKVFPSNWWAQRDNGIAYRWKSASRNFADYTSKPDDLSPVEKYDRLFNPNQEREVAMVEHWNARDLHIEDEAMRPAKHKHEGTKVIGPATKWELEHHGTYQTFAHPDSWWGHCNGWAAYATTEPDGAPMRDIRVKLVGTKVTECAADEADCTLFRMGDIEALMTELYFSDQATFAGRRCNIDPDKMERDEYGRPKDVSCRDLNAGSFHIGVTGLLNKGANYLGSGAPGKPSFVIDHNYDWEVWNFPLVKFEITEQKEITKEEAAMAVGAMDYVFNAAATRFVQVQLVYWMVSDGVDWFEMATNAYQRRTAQKRVELNYVLELNATGTILGGEWTEEPGTAWGEDNKKLHPDFYWMAVQHRGAGEDSDDLGGNNDNPFISYSKAKALLKCANDATTCAPPPPEPMGGPDSCIGNCNQRASGGCWCDSGCTQYNDCCTDYAAACMTGNMGGPDSCVGNCGEQASGGCWCDTGCSRYGDCCTDYGATCSQ